MSNIPRLYRVRADLPPQRVVPLRVPLAEVEKQLLQFPSGKYDDAVDVFSLIGRGLEFIRPVKKVRPKVVEQPLMAWNG